MGKVIMTDKTSAITALNKYEALAILYLDKKGIDSSTPEELVSKFLDTHDRIVREYNRQAEISKRRINPLPL